MSAFCQASASAIGAGKINPRLKPAKFNFSATPKLGKLTGAETKEAFELAAAKTKSLTRLSGVCNTAAVSGYNIFNSSIGTPTLDDRKNGRTRSLKSSTQEYIWDPFYVYPGY